MSCSTSISFHIPKALPSLKLLSQLTRKSHISITSKQSLVTCKFNTNHKNTGSTRIIVKPFQCFNIVGAILATVYEKPALAMTGIFYEQDPTSALIQSGIVAFIYFIVMPPIIMNWLRIRWYKRNLLETYFQFMFVFIFYIGIALWAPFLNFRKFPRDPDLKYPWDKPKDLSKIRNAYSKSPFADADDYA